MDISQESDPKSQDEIPVLSSYVKNLESHVRERYLKKISVVGVDPAAIPSEQFSSECLPPIEVSDLFSYLVLETSCYINKQFKAFKSLGFDCGVFAVAFATCLVFGVDPTFINFDAQGMRPHLATSKKW